MSAVAESIFGRSTGGATSAPWAAIDVATGLDALKPAWRELETQALATPYQSLGWVEAYAATVARSHRLALRFVAVRDASSQPLALLPLEIDHRLGVTVAGFVGRKHANYHMGLFRPDFAAGLDRDGAARLAAEIGIALGDVDALAFVNQPADWNGVANPFALLATGPSPSAAYKLALVAGDGEATLRRSLSSHALKKLRHKRRRIADLGDPRSFRAITADEIERTLAAFFRQKAQRFASLGIADPFADPAIQAFIRQGVAAADGEAPALELHALELSGEPVAIFLGAVQGGRFSGMATSFSGSGDVLRCSPGEILLADLITAKAAEGFDWFDLGVGEARYKTTFCDGRDDLVDSLVPLTAKGQLYSVAARLELGLKRYVKRSPRLLTLAETLRRGRGRALATSGD